MDLNLDNLLPQTQDGNTDSLQIPTTDDSVELEIGPGKREKFTRQQLSDFYKGNLRQEDYTRKTQELAEQRRQFETNLPQIKQIYQEHQALVQLLEDKDKINKYVKERFKEAAEEGTEFNPKEFSAAKQQVASLQQQIEHMKNQLQVQPQQLIEHTRNEIETATLEGKISAHLETIFTATPLLGAIDNAEDILRFKVFNRKPKDISEARAFFTEEAQNMVNKVAEHFKQAKPAPKASTGGAKRSIEPPGGVGSPAPQPNSYKGKDGKVDWSKVDQMADAFLKSYND